MDKKLMLAVAGSGKSSFLVRQLDLERRVLLLTYTENNVENLRRKIAVRFGYLPANVRVQSYFQFLNGFCFRPFFARMMGCRGITFRTPPDFSRTKPLGTNARFLDTSHKAYYSRMARLFAARNVLPELIARVSRYYDALYVDEAQDLGGHDFDLMQALIAADIEVLWVGDFHQHTFSTSADGNVNLHLYKSYEGYLNRIRQSGMKLDTTTLVKSWRCGEAICKFVRDDIGIQMHSTSEHDVRVQEVKDRDEGVRLLACPQTVKLFYDMHHVRGCYSENWGGSKGIDHYEDVCVVLNPGVEAAYRKGELHKLAPLTRNKFYVACTRARGNLYLLPESLMKERMARRKGGPRAVPA